MYENIWGSQLASNKLTSCFAPAKMLSWQTVRLLGILWLISRSLIWCEVLKEMSLSIHQEEIPNRHQQHPDINNIHTKCLHTWGSAATLCIGQGQHATAAPAVAAHKHLGSRHWCFFTLVWVKDLIVDVCTLMFCKINKKSSGSEWTDIDYSSFHFSIIHFVI